MTEVWRPVPGYEGLYEVSDLGRVKRLAGAITHRNRWRVMTRRKPEKLISASKHRNGHLRLALYRDGVGELLFVHRIVASAFLSPEPEGRPLVAHRDGDPENNRPSNLYWATPAENSADAIRHGTQVRGERVGISRLNADLVREIRRRVAAGEGYSALARELQVNPRTIKLAATGETWTHV